MSLLHPVTRAKAINEVDLENFAGKVAVFLVESRNIEVLQGEKKKR